MAHPLIGQVLSRMGNLSPIDIDEILTEQAMNHRQFGEIALAWGLCDTDQLCEAWCKQLAEASDLSNFAAPSLDSDTNCVPPETVRRMLAVPLRVIGNDLIMAASRLLEPEEIAELIRLTGHDVRVILTDPARVKQMIDQRYGAAEVPTSTCPPV